MSPQAEGTQELSSAFGGYVRGGHLRLPTRHQEAGIE